MAIQKEVWISDIENTLFAGSEFIQKSTDHSAYVSDKTVHVPQSGAAPTITKDRSSYPATISQRTDTDLTYSLASFDTAPILVADIEELQTNYDKRQSVLSQHIGALNDRLGLETAYNWAGVGAANIVRTSGTAAADALSPGATGNRLAVVKADIKAMAKKLDKDNLPSTGRFLLMPTDMYYQLFSDNTLVSRDYAEGMAQESGVINSLYGFKIMQRPTTVVYTNAATPVKKAVGAATATTDNLACLGWHESAVSNALGDIKVFNDEDRADYYGSVFSAMVMHGSAILRSGSEGVVSLVQGT